MKINLFDVGGVHIAEIVSNNIEVSGAQDALDIMANCGYHHDAKKIIIYEPNIIPDFFDLKTGMAGEILQKFSNYNVQLAIVGEYSKFTSKSLIDFIFESNKSGRIFFVSSVDEAKEKLVK